MICAVNIYLMRKEFEEILREVFMRFIKETYWMSAIFWDEAEHILVYNSKQLGLSSSLPLYGELWTVYQLCENFFFVTHSQETFEAYKSREKGKYILLSFAHFSWMVKKRSYSIFYETVLEIKICLFK